MDKRELAQALTEELGTFPGSSEYRFKFEAIERAFEGVEIRRGVVIKVEDARAAHA